MRYLLVLGVILSFLLAGCAGLNLKQETVTHVVEVKVSSVDGSPVEVEVGKERDGVSRGMNIPNIEGSLSNLSFILGDEGFIKIFSSLTVGDVTRLWNDITYFHKATNIRKLTIFINSPGGDAFSGLALADHLERAQNVLDFKITAYASGIIASAAVPVYAVCGTRYASQGTIFMVHETSIWKWPGRETASDIRSQNALMNMLRDSYLEKLAQYSKLSKDEWGHMEGATTWFSAEQAKEWGIVDKIE